MDISVSLIKRVPPSGKEILTVFVMAKYKTSGDLPIKCEI
jgi:hypothetical protein